MFRIAPFALVSSLFLITACGDSSPRPTPKPERHAGLGLPSLSVSASKVADDFLRAVKAEDVAGWERVMTAAAVEASHAEGGATMSFSGENLDSWNVGAESVEGDEAGVAITIVNEGVEQAMTLKLRREHGNWRVRGMAVPMGESEWFVDFEGGNDALGAIGEELAEGLAEGLAESMTEAFETAAAEWEAGGSSDEIAALHWSFESLVSVDEAQHDAAWRVDVEAAGRPAVEVLAELLDDAGLPYAHGDHFEHASGVSLTSVSRLEALEALCVEADVRPVFPDAMSQWNGGSSELTFEPGTRAWPASFTGPFMVEAHDLEEHAPNSTGEVRLTVRALGLHPAVVAANTQMEEYLAIGGLSSTRGANLRADEDVHYMGSPTVTGGLFEYSLSLDLVGLLRDVESFDVTGEVVLTLPSEVHVGEFPNGHVEAPVQAGPWSITWQEPGQYNQFGLEHADGETGETGEAGVRFAPRFASGEPMGVQSENASSMFNHVSASLSTPEAPASLTLKVFTPTELRSEFQVAGVRLSHFAEQPAQLEPLAFSGAAPIEVGFEAFVDRSDPDFPKVRLSVASHCNLPAESAQVTLQYLDAAGSQLHEFPHSLTGEMTFEGTQPLAALDTELSQETTSFFMPAETASIRVRVDSVEFLNGTTWSRE